MALRVAGIPGSLREGPLNKGLLRAAVERWYKSTDENTRQHVRKFLEAFGKGIERFKD